MSTISTSSLNIPQSNNIATVRVIDSTSTIHIPVKLFVTPQIKGHDDLNCPAFSFLITDSSGKRNILFDLGVQKDFKTKYSKHVLDRFEKIGVKVDVKKDIGDILDECDQEGIPKTNQIESIIWSHHHFDHTGNPQKFPKSTSLIVGPGFKKSILPGYPKDEKSPINSELWEDRELIEIEMNDQKRGNFKIGNLDAFDYFGDSSFYLLSTPGHAPGHLCGLARVTPTTFIFMGADAAHHGGEIRPNEFRRIPKNVSLPSSKQYNDQKQCPGELLENIVSDSKSRGKSEPFYEPTENMCENKEDAIKTIKKITNFDGTEDVFIILAHDRSLLDKIPQFPKTINDWKDFHLANKFRWSFLDDFSQAVDDE